MTPQDIVESALRDGVKWIPLAAGQEPPNPLPPRAIIGVRDDDNVGPAGFRLDPTSQMVEAIFLIHPAVPPHMQIIANAARQGVAIVVLAGDTFDSWFSYFRDLGVLPNLCAIPPEKRRLQ